MTVTAMTHDTGSSRAATGLLLAFASASTFGMSGVLARDGRLPEPLRAGIAPPSEEELAGWHELQPGGEAIAEQGSRPMDPAAGKDFYVRTWAEPAVDVHGGRRGRRPDGGPPPDRTAVGLHADEVALVVAAGLLHHEQARGRTGDRRDRDRARLRTP